MGSAGSVVDKNSPDRVSKELCSSAIQGAQTRAQEEDALREAFRTFDRDGNGEISKKEFTMVLTHLTKLNRKFTQEQLETLFDAADKDKDGAIQFEELCAWLCDTPCFSQYFRELDLIQREYVKMVETKQKGDEHVKTEEQSTEWYATQIDQRLKPVLKQVFHSADKDQNGVLSEEESILFFKNYVDKLADYAKSTIKAEKRTWINGNHWLDKSALKQKLMPSMEEMVRKELEDYEAHADERNKAAFKVLDRNKDGKLVMEEVEPCLIPGTYRYREFHKALKMSTPEAFKEAFDQITMKAAREGRRKSDPKIQLLLDRKAASAN